MEYFGSKGEEREELEKIAKMTVYERMVYLRELAEFFMVLDMIDIFTIKDLCKRIIFITKGYDK